MNLCNVPEMIFILGRLSDDNKFSFTFHRDKQNVRFLSIWDSKDLIEEWINTNSPGEVYSEFNRDHLVKIMVSNSACSVLFLNPNQSDGKLSEYETVDKLPIERAAWLNLENCMPLIESILGNTGINDDQLDEVRLLSKEKWEMNPMEFIKFIGEHFSELANCFDSTIGELKSKGIFDRAWGEHVKALKSEDTPEYRIEFIREIGEKHPEFTLKEALNYGAMLPEEKICTLDEREEFEVVMRMFESQMIEAGLDKEKIDDFKKVCRFQKEMTLMQVVTSMWK